MEIAGLKVAWEQARNAGVLLYSLVIAATIIPGFTHVPNLAIILYYAIVPGYFITLILRETGTILERVFFSVAWSITMVASIYAIKTLGYLELSTNLILPALTIMLLIYDHFHKDESVS